MVFDGKVINLYARGLTVRGIQGHLTELCGTEVSPDLTSRVTDAVVGYAWPGAMVATHQWRSGGR